MKVFTPSDARREAHKNIPDFVIRAFNELLAENWNEKEIKLEQYNIVERILAHADGSILRSDIFKKNWLDVEPIYENNGWIVKFVKDPYYDYDHNYFLFTPKSK